MKYLVPVLIVVLFINCKRAVNKTEKVVVKQSPAAKIKPPNYAKLTDAFVRLSFDTLDVFSIDNLDSIGYKYRGTQLDSTNLTLLGGRAFYSDQYYANFKFDIDERRVGLIARVPSQYESSSITLFVYDKSRELISEKLELAENWGDAGAVFQKRSWIFKDEQGRFKCLLWQSYFYDPAISGEEDLKPIDEKHYYLVDLNHSVTDTINRNAKDVFRKMKNRHTTGY